MKISIRATCGQDVDDALAAELSLATSHLPDFYADSPEFDRLLEVSKTRSRCWFNPWMEFSESELAQSRSFQLEGRGKLLTEKAGDYDLNIARLRGLPFITTGPGAKIRLMDRLALRGASLKPNEVGCASHWMAEFVVSREIGRIFKSEGLADFSLRPVFDSKTKRDYDSFFQIYTDRIMPRALVDATTPVHPDYADPDYRRQLACLSYDFKGTNLESDFYRTAEAWSNNDMPVWIVSARVRECFRRHKLRGWAFRPVLETGSELHATYTRMWEDLFARVARSHPHHFF